MELTPRRRRLSFFSVFFTYLVDLLGWSIVFPIFAPFFLDPHNHIFSADISINARTTVLGIFLAAYPLAQFFGAPVLGEWADKYGRKKAFLISITLTTIGYGLTAFSMMHSLLVLLFAARLMSGLFSGNLSICLAAISDLSPNEKAKIRYFGYLSVLAGLAFIIGTFVGGKFSDAKVNPLFSPDLPLWMAAGLSFLNLLFVIFGFTETYRPDKDARFDFLESIHNIQQALKTKRIKSMYMIYFLFVVSWTILLQFTPVHMIRFYHFTNSDIGTLSACMGIGWAFGSGLISRFLTRFFSPLKSLEVTLIVLTYFCAMIAFPDKLQFVLIFLAASVITAGVAWPLCTGVISNLAPKNIQGKIMGMSQSMQSLAMTISPIIGGISYELFPRMIFFLSAFISLIAALIYFRLKD